MSLEVDCFSASLRGPATVPEHMLTRSGVAGLWFFDMLVEAKALGTFTFTFKPHLSSRVSDLSFMPKETVDELFHRGGFTFDSINNIALTAMDIVTLYDFFEQENDLFKSLDSLDGLKALTVDSLGRCYQLFVFASYLEVKHGSWYNSNELKEFHADIIKKAVQGFPEETREFLKSSAGALLKERSRRDDEFKGSDSELGSTLVVSGPSGSVFAQENAVGFASAECDVVFVAHYNNASSGFFSSFLRELRAAYLASVSLGVSYDGLLRAFKPSDLDGLALYPLAALRLGVNVPSGVRVEDFVFSVMEFSLMHFNAVFEGLPEYEIPLHRTTEGLRAMMVSVEAAVSSTYALGN